MQRFRARTPIPSASPTSKSENPDLNSWLVRYLSAGPLNGLRKIVCGLMAAFGMLSLSSASSIQLTWDRNPEVNISYEVKYGTASGIYPNTIDAGTNTTATISNLDKGTTYYFVVVARNTAGLLGPKSAEVSGVATGAAASIPPNGTITSPAAAITIEAGEQVTFSGEGTDPNGETPLKYRWDFGNGSSIPDATVRNPGNRRFNHPGTYTVTLTVKNAAGLSDPTPAVQTIIVNRPGAVFVSQKLWKLKFVDSQEATGYAATNAFDGNPGTFWHTKFSSGTLIKKPHEIQIDMGKASRVIGFQYLPRQDGYNIGDIGSYQFYVSMDGKKWGNPVASGAFVSSTSEKQVFFTPKRGRFVRLRSMKEANGYTDCNVAELRVLETVKTRSTASAATAVSHAVTSASPASSSKTAAGFAGTPADTSAFHSTPPTITTEVIDGQKYLSLTVTKPLVPDGVKRTIQVSPDLLDWFSGEKHTTVLTDNDSILKVRDNTPITRDAKRFIRLKSTPR